MGGRGLDVVQKIKVLMYPFVGRRQQISYRRWTAESTSGCQLLLTVLMSLPITILKRVGLKLHPCPTPVMWGNTYYSFANVNSKRVVSVHRVCDVIGFPFQEFVQ